MTALAGPAMAGVQLYVDSAPNVYGSPDYAAWWAQAKADVVAGSFQDLRNGTYPGTHTIDPLDEIVYSTMDLGKRLHFIYWIPGETKASLNGRFEANYSADWDGVESPWGWYQPSSWQEYSGGVIGTFGDAWWASDNEALPNSSNASPWDEVDAADVAALRATVLQAQTHVLGSIRIREDVNASWVTTELEVGVVPEPSTFVVWSLLGLVAGGFGIWRRKK
ncbi:MAG: hypothetical protein ACYC35_11135 [Pirellulales bacterium]